MNIVIGAALSYSEDKMRNFILSFRQYNKEDKLVLLVNDESAENLKAMAEKHSIDFIRYNLSKKAQLNNSRFMFFHKYLKEHRFNNVLISDTRDVVFQGNPFDKLPERYLYCFCEDSGSTIGTEEFNSYWIRNLYGPERLEEIAPQPIVCAGTILGSYGPMMMFLEVILDEFYSLDESVFLKHPIDQGIVNNLCHTPFASLIPITLKNNGDIVATVGLTAKENVGKDKMLIQDNVMKLNDLTSTIVHQYNRDDGLQRFFDSLYAGLV
jgi:hypothetical protein